MIDAAAARRGAAKKKRYPLICERQSMRAFTRVTLSLHWVFVNVLGIAETFAAQPSLLARESLRVNGAVQNCHWSARPAS
jgi:hypothetical protein